MTEPKVINLSKVKHEIYISEHEIFIDTVDDELIVINKKILKEIISTVLNLKEGDSNEDKTASNTNEC